MKEAPYPISVRIPPQELLLVREAAWIERKSVSRFIRESAVTRAGEVKPRPEEP